MIHCSAISGQCYCVLVQRVSAGALYAMCTYRELDGQSVTRVRVRVHSHHGVPGAVGSVTANTAASTLGEPTQTHHNINVIIISFIEKVSESKRILS